MNTAKVIPLQSVNALINQTRAAWDRADQKAADADDWYLRTGKKLVELKGRVGHGNWLKVLKEIGRSERRAQELMELAGGKKTLSEQRERVRDRERTRRKDASNARYTAHLEKAREHSETEDTDDEEQSPEERWVNSFANIMGEIISHPAYWDKHFPGWRSYELPSHIKTLTREAATVFASIVKNRS